MSEPHGGTPDGPVDPSAGNGSPWWEPGQERLADVRREVQFRAIVSAFAAEGIPVGIAPGDDRPGEGEYLYRRGVVLTRDADVDRVLEVIGRQERPDKGRRSRAASGGDGPGRTGGAFPGLTAIDLGDGVDTLAVLDELDRRLGTGVATPDHVVHLCPKASACPATEPVPAEGEVDPPLAKDADLGAGVRISVIDTGLLADLAQATPWLAGVTGDPELASVGHYRGHGTFIAGVVRAMAPAAEVDVEAFLFVGGALLESDLAPALGRALDTMPDIISMSAGTTTRTGAALLSLQVFWEERLRHTKGTVLVCAAGNDGNRGPFYPATYPWTISVGALDVDGSRAGYSNVGSWVDVSARGSDVVNAYPDGDYTYVEPPLTDETATFRTGLASWSGTSFSTPLVSGLIAARMSWSGESARQAADALLALAQANGAVLEPGMADRPA